MLGKGDTEHSSLCLRIVQFKFLTFDMHASEFSVCGILREAFNKQPWRSYCVVCLFGYNRNINALVYTTDTDTTVVSIFRYTGSVLWWVPSSLRCSMNSCSRRTPLLSRSKRSSLQVMMMLTSTDSAASPTPTVNTLSWRDRPRQYLVQGQETAGNPFTNIG